MSQRGLKLWAIVITILIFEQSLLEVLRDDDKKIGPDTTRKYL